MERAEIEKKTTAATLPPGSAAHTGNCIAIFTMFIMQDLLVQQLVNPITNFNNIIVLATTIAGLNSSIKQIQ
jgi:hypothetical protein